jgi:uncharacterized membrane protein
MVTWWIVLVCDLIIPILMFVFGILMMKKVPKTINNLVGYRTTLSMKNQETWEFAQKHCGRLWWKIGLINLVATVMVHIPFYSSDEDVIGVLATVITVLQLVVLLVSIVPTELALKKTFNCDGTRK